MIPSGSIVTLKSDSLNELFVVSYDHVGGICTCIKWCDYLDVQDFIELKIPKACLQIVEGPNTSRDDASYLIAGEVLAIRGSQHNRRLFTVSKGAEFEPLGKVEVMWFGSDGKLQTKPIRLIALTRVKPRPE